MTMPDARVRWHCRRGMRELDELLMHYFDSAWNAASDGEKAAFRRLLALADPELVGYLLRGRSVADGVTARVIGQILSRTDPGEPAAEDSARFLVRSHGDRRAADS